MICLQEITIIRLNFNDSNCKKQIVSNLIKEGRSPWRMKKL